MSHSQRLSMIRNAANRVRSNAGTLAAIGAARFLSPSVSHESVTLFPVPSAHNSAQLSPSERATLSRDLLSYRIARDLQGAREQAARGYALAIV